MGNVFFTITSDTDKFDHDATNKKITLLKNISWQNDMGFSAFNYIGLPESYIFDGNNHTIDVTSLSMYGLFTSEGSSIESSCIIKNLGVLNGETTINGGFVMRPYQSFFIIENCYSTGEISGGDGGAGSGGIAGSVSGAYGQCVIKKCYSTGNISGRDCGGIVADYVGEHNGMCIIENCYSRGNITGEEAGGIVGGIASGNGTNGTCIVTNCYSSGTIAGTNAGGIVGMNEAIPGVCTVTNCFSSRTDTAYGLSNTITFTNASFNFIDGYALSSQLINSLSTLPSDIFESHATNYPTIIVIVPDVVTLGNGYCLAGSTLILTNKGYIPIKNINKTMSVVLPSGKHIKIKHLCLIKNYKEELYCISKNHFGEGVPFKSLILSGSHKYYSPKSKKWHFPKYTISNYSKPLNPVDLYHIKLEGKCDGFIANGMIVESLKREI